MPLITYPFFLDKREKERSERPSKIIKLNSGSSATSERERERDRERERERERNKVIEINDEIVMPSPIIENDRHSSTRSLKDSKKDERSRDRERDREQREREREKESHRNQASDDIIITDVIPSSRSKRDKRREERYRHESSPVDLIEPSTTSTLTSSNKNNEYDRGDRDNRDRDYERNERGRDRDLSSVSNESIGSMPQRRSQDVIEYEKGMCDGNTFLFGA